MILGILALTTCFVLLVIAILACFMYDIVIPRQPKTELEVKCKELKERIRWLSWKLQEQNSKDQNFY